VTDTIATVASDEDGRSSGAGGSARIAVNGVGGRMGRQLLGAVAERTDARLVAAAEAPGDEAVGTEAGRLAGLAADELGEPVTVSDDIAADLDGVDVVIDFTTPASTLSLLERLAGTGTAVVLGATGLDAEQRERVTDAARSLPIVYAANYSVGVTLALDLLERSARALDADYDIELVEAHHRHKVDAPSGTALAMGEALARGRGRTLEEVALYAREGITGARERGTIGFQTLRGGDIVGEHTVLFVGAGERLEITHRAHQRMTFARGAVRAALWLVGRRSGLYDMRDVLGLSRARAGFNGQSEGESA